MRDVDELRPLTAGALLGLWQTCRAKVEDPLERTLLCNAAILRESCRFQGESVYADAEEVLRDLTPREMETLLLRLADGETGAEPANPRFDAERFAAMRGA